MKIHFIAIGGSIMHSLAIALKRNGHMVTGSDDIIREPSKSNLIAHNILPSKEGWYPNKIGNNLDMVILGMHAKKNNPELLEAQKKNIPILSFPEFVFNLSKEKKKIVIAGSHGKTTITAMIIHVLKDYNIEFDYLVGAKIDSIDNQVKLDRKKLIIIEGDEYFSSALDLTPKFMHYKADLLVVSGVSWDHINVFPTQSSYEEAFIKLINSAIQNSSKILYCKHDSFLDQFFTDHKTSAQSYETPDYKVKNGQFFLTKNNQKVPLHVFGKHNLENISAAQNVCQELGVSATEFYLSIQNFKGASRRLSLIKTLGAESSIYYDFAHSPSKVRATVNAVKELNPNRYLIACLELHTFSSLNRDFIPHYINVFDNCDESWVYVDEKELKRKGLLNLKSQSILDAFNHHNMVVIKNKEILSDKISNICFQNLNLLLMSSGNFSGVNIDDLID